MAQTVSVIVGADDARLAAVVGDRNRPQKQVQRARLNAVEGFFSILTRRRLKRGAFKAVADLQDAIARYIREHIMHMIAKFDASGRHSC